MFFELNLKPDTAQGKELSLKRSLIWKSLSLWRTVLPWWFPLCDSDHHGTAPIHLRRPVLPSDNGASMVSPRPCQFQVLSQIRFSTQSSRVQSFKPFVSQLTFSLLWSLHFDYPSLFLSLMSSLSFLSHFNQSHFLFLVFVLLFLLNLRKKIKRKHHQMSNLLGLWFMFGLKAELCWEGTKWERFKMGWWKVDINFCGWLRIRLLTRKMYNWG